MRGGLGWQPSPARWTDGQTDGRHKQSSSLSIRPLWLGGGEGRTGFLPRYTYENKQYLPFQGEGEHLWRRHSAHSLAGSGCWVTTGGCYFKTVSSITTAAAERCLGAGKL